MARSSMAMHPTMEWTEDFLELPLCPMIQMAPGRLRRDTALVNPPAFAALDQRVALRYPMAGMDGPETTSTQVRFRRVWHPEFRSSRPVHER